MRDREELRAAGYLVRIAVPNGKGGSREIDAISFKGLLAIARDAGLSGTSTELVQAPSEENRWTVIVRAQVTLPSGTFTGIGDANPDNVNPAVAQHAIRVCETRAIARALRVGLGIGEVSLEELDRFQWIKDRAMTERDARDDGRRSPKSERQAPPEPRVDNSERSRVARWAGEPPRGSRPPERPERFRGRDTRPTERRPDDDRLAMSDTQRKLLFRLGYDLVDRSRVPAFLLERLGVERFEWATRATASRVIDELRAEREERRAIHDEGHRGNGAAPPGEAAHG